MKSKGVNWLLIASIVLTVVSIVASHIGYLNRRASERWVTHTHQVIETTHKMLSNLMDAESSQHSFLLTSDSAYLPSYQLSLMITESLMDSLRSMVSDNTPQKELLTQQIIPANIKKIAEWDHTMNIFRFQGKESAVRFLETAKGNTLLDSIWVFTKKFIANEELLLVSRQAAVESENLTNNIIRYSGFSFIAIASILALITIKKQQRSNDALVVDLKSLNQDLEQRIRERTKELQKLNEQLFESNSQLGESLVQVRDLYDNAHCGYHSVNKEGVIERMNKTELNWLGYTEEEVVGKMHISKIVDSPFLSEREKNMKTLMKEGHLENIEFDMVRKDGTKFSALMNTSAVFDSTGAYVKNRSTVFDISQRKLLEQKLVEANDHLIQVNEEKNRFIGMTTHDLKNPLNGIAGLIHLIKTQTTLTDDQREYIAYIDDSVSKMKNLITKLLDLNRIEQSKNIVQKKEINLQSFLETILKGYDEAAQKKKIRIVLENPLGPLLIETDPTLLEQAIDNLLSNAIKFSKSDKKVWLRTARLTNNLLIEVEDQGPGIKPEEIPRLFGAFQRLSAQPTGGESSTGLGLSIAKELVKALGGEIKVESEVGKGTKFIFIVKI